MAKSQRSTSENWKFFQRNVQKLCADLQVLNSSAPRRIEFNKDNTKVYFLGAYRPGLYCFYYAQLSNQNPLIWNLVELDESSISISNPVISCLKNSLTRSNSLSLSSSTTSSTGLPSTTNMSAEDILLRERQRASTMTAVSSFLSHTEDEKYLLSTPGKLYMYYGNSKVSKLIFNEKKRSRFDSKICPFDSNMVSFVSKGDIYVIDIETDREVRLTYSRGSDDDDALSSGLAEYVIQEEFGRYTGYWWAPERTEFYKILYLEVDESMVLEYDTSLNGNTSTMRYPSVGTANAKAKVKMIYFSKSNSSGVANIVRKELNVNLKEMFPWYEYIAQVTWLDSTRILLQIFDRLQLRTAYVCFYETDFVEKIDPTPSSVRPIFVVEDRSDVWINFYDNLRYIQTQDPVTNEIYDYLLIDSEITGFNQLYLVPLDDTSIKVPLTKGHQVVDQVIAIDEKKCVIYFTSSSPPQLETHLFAIAFRHRADGSIDIPHDAVRLTKPGFSYLNISINEDFSLLSASKCNLRTPPTIFIAYLNFNEQVLANTSMESITPITTLLNIERPLSIMRTYPEPQMISCFNNEGIEFFGLSIYPPNMNPLNKYPVILYVYGGPGVQMIKNEFKGRRLLRLQMMASLGYVVVMFDSRGSTGRGVAFESHIKNKCGQLEIKDQVGLLEHFLQTNKFADRNRVCIHGWSYGGYLSLLGLAQRPDIFKVAISGAPVTSWGFYDTAYTEKYMSLPGDNVSGYRLGSVLNRIRDFPDDPGRLLLIHGLIDENVHFENTTRLIEQLSKHCKPFDIHVYPNERHGIRSQSALIHYETTVLNYLYTNL